MKAVCEYAGKLDLTRSYSDENGVVNRNFNRGLEFYNFKSAVALFDIASRYDFVIRESGTVKGKEYTLEFASQDFKP